MARKRGHVHQRKPLHLETDASGVGLGASILQVRDNQNGRYDEVPENEMLQPIAFASKSLSSTEQWYSNIEREALTILHGLQKFHHSCFSHKAHVITDQRPLVVIMGKDVAMLSQ